jgi:hypothetical protein
MKLEEDFDLDMMTTKVIVHRSAVAINSASA